jgi:RND family efflux transporter MFP subunit
MEAKNADLSALRINRDAEQRTAPSGSRWRVRVAVATGTTAVVVISLLAMRSSLRSAVEVRLAPATMVSPGQVGAVLVASGYVVAQRRASVASKGTGRLVYLGVVEGDRVRTGQVIARLEDADVRAQLAQARANLQLSQADLKNVERSLERARALQDSGFTTAASVDSAEARHLQVQSGIAVAEAVVQGAEVALENTVIRAPFDGTVLTKDADVGEVVAPLAASAFSKAAVVTIADLRSLQVEADVSESNLEGVTVGQRCEIVLDAYPDQRYPAYVTMIVPTADRAKATVQVKVAFSTYDARVLPEMSAKVHFLPAELGTTAADTTPRLTVPAGAVVERDGRTLVFAVERDRATEIPVTIGPRLGGHVTILHGLAAGALVIDSVGDGVRSGVKVKIRQGSVP